MSHEQSETVQLPNGRWVNVYGRNTPQAGTRLDDLDYATVGEAVRAARLRSANTPVAMERRKLGPHIEGVDFEADLADQIRPASLNELQRELARTKDPKIREILQNQLDQNTAMAKDVGSTRVVNFEGRVHHFPADATDEEISAALEGLTAPAGPRASQADVRAAEPREVSNPFAAFTPKRQQEIAETRFDAARAARLKRVGGLAIPTAAADRAATAAESGIQDPEETKSLNAARHMAQTGEYVDDSGVGYEATKALAAIGGFALAGPAGATAAELGMRYALLKRQMADAIKQGMPEDEAESILARELAGGITLDAAMNFGIPVLGQWLAKISGKLGLGARLSSILEKTFGPSSIRDAKIAKRAALAETPERKQAVEELSKRLPKDKMLTPGQVAGEASTWEAQARKSSPAPFARQEKIVHDATEGMRQEAFYPGGQPKRSTLGERIVQIADDTAKAVKERLRPAWEAADNLGIKVDLSGVAARAKAALAADAARPKPKLVDKEIGELQDIIARIEGKSGTVPGALPVERGLFSTEAAIDMQSTFKQGLRATTADWKPSDFYTTIVNGLMKDVDGAFDSAIKNAVTKSRATGDVLAAARQSGAASKAYGEARNVEKVVADLNIARKEYREMMETVFDDAMKTALRKEAGGSPEDIGTFLYQSGKVSRLSQLHDLLALSNKEGKLSPGRVEKMQRDVTRSFLQEMVPNVEALANWSTRLAEQPRRKETWDVLTSTPGGKELHKTVKVLEEAAKMALTDTTRLTGAPLLLNPGAAESFTRRGLSGAQKPHFLIAALSYTGLMRAAATAYTHGDKGVFNWITTIVRVRNARTGAAAKAGQAAAEKLQAWAEKNGVKLSDEDEQPE